ncbi:ABC transporter permease [Bacteroides sp. 51]|uniref:ABC transporter permease n=1 Tax=Bacteroides sp. 51 TaxID=2302938 RepID=UPI0013D4DBA8|nr:FtsX-like permease family protein [Bacteroides sp. 51]NDV83899.1 ABC transporter permease [Bacteroides sp. 51]
MMRHIIKVIWNERKSNVLIFLEFIVVFCVFWFCSDYLYYIGSRYFEPLGYDIKHTYLIEMRMNADIEEAKDDRYGHTMILQERLEKYPGIEGVSISRAAIPYGNSTSSQGQLVNNDSIAYTVLVKQVNPGYFDVFKMNLEYGRIFNEVDVTNEDRVALISPNRNGYFQDEKNPAIPITEVKQLRRDKDDDKPYTVIGVTGKQKRSAFNGYDCAMFKPLTRSQYEIKYCETVVRVNPDAAEGFMDRFRKEMKDQLLIGPYYLDNVTSLEERKERYDEGDTGDEIKSVLAITAFLFINVFLGIIGTFWSRTESRRSEIGLRLALGSSKRKVQWQMFTETMILLLIASLIGAYICVNLGQSELLETIGIPLADYKQAGFGSGHYFLNYGITLLFLAIISGFAVWYPSRLASRIQPADTLRAE